MDELFSAIAALMFWRLIVSTLGAIVLAALLSRAIAPFTAEYCITLVILGMAFGCYWQGRAESGVGLLEKVEEPAISKPVAFIGLAFIGLVAGGFLSELFGSKAGGAVALVICASIVALWFRHTKQRPITRRSFAFSVVAVLFGYSGLLALSLWRAL